MRATVFLSAICAGAAVAAGPPAPPSPEIGVNATPAAWVLTDAGGKTLYVYDRDTTPGQSACAAACAQLWPPVLAAAVAEGFGPWSQIIRADGARQWTYKGRPLYTYAKENVPGVRFGERPENTAWHVAEEPVPTPPEVILAKRMGATVLADLEGRILYWRDADRGRTAEERRRWRPLSAPWLAAAFGDWSVVISDDELPQWAYRGRALYVDFNSTRDQPIDLSPAANTWQPAIVTPAPPAPAWVTVQATDGGEVLADPDGLTLYAYEAEQNINRPSGGASERGCNAYCMNEFKPVKAALDAVQIGEWLPIVSVSGARQWSYKGMAVYTHAKDRRPGDIVGTKAYRVWHAIMRSGEAMQGTGGG